MRLFHAKLTALAYPGSETFDVTDDLAFKRLVAWLEENRIRHYSADDRAKLLNVDGDSNAWLEAFRLYLAAIHCPKVIADSAADDRSSVTEWLLSRAVSLQYGDTFQNQQQASAASGAGTPPIRNPLDRLDFEADEFKKGVSELAALLKIPAHPDHKEVLKACCVLIVERLSPEALSRAKEQSGRVRIDKIRLDEVPVGFETSPGSGPSADLARILRLLYLSDLRTLQTQINHAIVQVQAITADPKTDERLGKVGR